MLSYLYQKHLINRFECILAHKNTMLVWLNNPKKICLKSIRKYGVIDQGKYRKISSKIKFTDRKYYVQDNPDVAHKEVKIYYNTNQLPELPFCGPHPIPHGARVSIKHYHLRFDPKLGHVIYAICHIPYDYVTCKSMLYQPWIYYISSEKQARYQPVKKCTYWPVIVSYNDWNIIHLSQKSTPFEAF